MPYFLFLPLLRTRAPHQPITRTMQHSHDKEILIDAVLTAIDQHAFAKNSPDMMKIVSTVLELERDGTE
jgi:hypothetical protein